MTQPALHFYEFGEGVKAFSSTRKGGCSKGNYREFNINYYCGDSEEAIQRNRASLCHFLGISEDRLIMPHQVHQTKVVAVDEAFLGLSNAERKVKLEGVDALMTDLTNVCIGVSTADCIPVLIYDRVKRVSCTIHAGWRGTVKRIVETAVEAMISTYGSRPSDLLAQIGPGIHLESFEVGGEVYEAFAKEGFAMETISQRFPTADDSSIEKWHIDLPMCNCLQLLSKGIPQSQISVSEVCTFQQSETYFSARRMGINSGRIFTGILML